MSEGSENRVSQAIPRWIEPRKFANKAVKLSGLLTHSGLPRLAAAVDQLGDVKAELQFDQTEDYRKTLVGHVSADVQRSCQRCLDPMLSTIGGDFKLMMVLDEEQAENIPGTYDPWIVTDEEADLYEIVEEELLLNLPLIVMHEEQCVEKEKFTTGQAKLAESKKVSPFDVLKQIKKTKD